MEHETPEIRSARRRERFSPKIWSSCRPRVAAVLTHFWLSDGFALIVLIVPDRDGAQLCRDELERLLAERSSGLARQEPATPEELVDLSNTLLDLPFGSEMGAVWIAAVVPRSAPDFSAWEAAWRQALQGLNQQRNPLRRHFQCPLIIVAAPWIVPLFREAAPDLWSIRSQVVWIEPDREATRPRSGETERASTRSQQSARFDAPDPALALQEAERLRGSPGRERERAAMLTRAGSGRRGDPQGAEYASRRCRSAGGYWGCGLARHHHGPCSAARSWIRAAPRRRRKTFRRALALKEEGGATAVSRGITMDNLGRAHPGSGPRRGGGGDLPPRAGARGGRRRHGGLARHHDGSTSAAPSRDQGRAAEAEEDLPPRAGAARRKAATRRSRAASRWICSAARSGIRAGAAEAEATFRRALALTEVEATRRSRAASRWTCLGARSGIRAVRRRPRRPSAARWYWQRKAATRRPRAASRWMCSAARSWIRGVWRRPRRRSAARWR